MCGDGGGGGDGGAIGTSDATGRGGEHGSAIGSGGSDIGGSIGGIGSGGRDAVTIGGSDIGYGGGDAFSPSAPIGTGAAPGTEGPSGFSGGEEQAQEDATAFGSDPSGLGLAVDTGSVGTSGATSADLAGALGEDEGGFSATTGAKTGFTVGSMFGLPAGLIGAMIGGMASQAQGDPGDGYGGGDPDAGGGPWAGDPTFKSQGGGGPGNEQTGGGSRVVEDGFTSGAFSGGSAGGTVDEGTSVTKKSNPLNFSGDRPRRERYGFDDDDSLLNALLFDDPEKEFNKSLF